MSDARRLDMKLPSQHEDIQAGAINATRFRRWSTLLALKTTAKLWRKQETCQRISAHTVVKCILGVSLMEAKTLQYIAANTSLPVPKVRCAFEHKDIQYTVMSRIRGKPITAADMSPSMFAQLEAMLKELRSLKPPPDVGVESCDRGPLYDFRIAHSDELPFGPFKTIPEFHFWLRKRIDTTKLDPKNTWLDDEDRQELRDMGIWQDHPNWPQPVFTHGDLHPGNILAHKGKIVGIIDWELSGWDPYYWEYTAAWCGAEGWKSWRSELERFLQPFPEELKMERIRNRHFGQI